MTSEGMASREYFIISSDPFNALRLMVLSPEKET